MYQLTVTWGTHDDLPMVYDIIKSDSLPDLARAIADKNYYPGLPVFGGVILGVTIQSLEG